MKSLMINLQNPKFFLESPATYLNILSNRKINYFIKSPSSRFLHCNEGFTRITGISNSIITDKAYDENLPWAEYASDYKLCDRKVMRNESILLLEPIITISDKRIIILTNKIPIVTIKNEICGILGNISCLSKTNVINTSYELMAPIKKLYGVAIDSNYEIVEQFNIDSCTLTKAESVILFLLLRGYSPSMVAKHTHKSKRTVECHILHIKDKLGVFSRDGLIEFSHCKKLHLKIPSSILMHKSLSKLFYNHHPINCESVDSRI